MSTMFPPAGKARTGYDRQQVEEFFARARAAYENGPAPTGAPGTAGGQGTFDEKDVRGAAFDLVRDGYTTAAVDAALDRLEAAFVQRRRTTYVAAQGEAAWMDHIAELATTLYPRLLRPAGQRFRAPERGRGYDRAAVDTLLERLVAYFDDGGELTAAEVRSTTFPAARASQAYHEGTVDAFLDRTVEVLVAVE
ncbi:DivIVA domain-containing protein [Georgenia yuyongxinii]|uniref:DivIVA domain-containing protein n=1 Tax=Georgenia yuyongxinii TaxID=2589797 RepID=A0A552WQR0_9MICO|nr:DivIVA domain-containing protein [Georgenia yuyongxinii]TRW45148.1 DivIVA domain-containing protein [Georgenia yuyongxinii]